MLYSSSNSFAGKITWQIKREIGSTTVWKNNRHADIRATVQLLPAAKSLNKIGRTSAFISGLLDKKKKGLSYLGITNWLPKTTKWISEDRLFISGTYQDRKGHVIYFEEIHLFEKDARTIYLVTAQKQSNLERSAIDDLININQSRRGR